MLDLIYLLVKEEVKAIHMMSNIQCRNFCMMIIMEIQMGKQVSAMEQQINMVLYKKQDQDIDLGQPTL